ncbi:hypothetical protein IQ17_07070 [Bradyrhizobium daqingense]|uniref:Uncharacterized protein n=1 Tax=Bradyrhizobium daqingense TaxID=993502 RepID=A0A562KC40_9BRAD|nr:hypothetical protein IQ17_07070 [Bradyrhizobium daqingense]
MAAGEREMSGGGCALGYLMRESGMPEGNEWPEYEAAREMMLMQ